MHRTRTTAAALALALSCSVLSAVSAATADASTGAAGRVLLRHDPVVSPAKRLTGKNRAFHGGKVKRTRRAISGTRHDLLYQQARYGVSSYRTRLAPGTYSVRLYAAEVQRVRPGRRVFDVYAEGRKVVRRLDISRAAGRNRAYQVTFPVTVRDGRLDIAFTKVRGTTKVSGIRIFQDVRGSKVTTPDRAGPSTGSGSSAPRPGPATGSPGTGGPGPGVGPSAAQRFFTADGPFNLPVPTAPALDPRSSSIVRSLASGAHPGVANLYAYGVPIFDADSSTPRAPVPCSSPWGVCELSTMPVPVPDDAVATPYANDGAMVVIDQSTRTAYEFWKARKSNGVWTAAWGGVSDLDGPGTPGSAVGSGISRLAGVVRADEIRRGRIDHALVFSTNNACRSSYRFPASKTDGSSNQADCIAEGARIQLDPSIDLASVPGLTRGERAVARALQLYGAYAIDNGGANMAFVFEVPRGDDPYPDAGLAWDYFGMDRIPWSGLRVLSSWNGR